ncbi:TfoX/Sxy family protein [Pelagibacterium xiamenense]|uniref:TfoX/Sxy family protein n=1 Tax=Pelagibacterium xiamenense TaxID=2901140 RepID=UPI001E506FFD|nr:TfoX/Sxy family protein [Pelagibacterium xiamenense]MCD7059982.1 TfoX/Sxy family protein [Pelagibacterium xiamenense]
MSLASEELAERIRVQLANRPNIVEKKMFGGIAFMVDGNMLVGPMKDGSLLVRVGKDGYEAALAQPGCNPMTMGEKTMSGFVEVDGDFIEDDDTLAEWIVRAWDFVKTLPPK